MSDVGETKGGKRTPPYISFSTFVTFISELKTNGLPPRIDSSVLKRFSGGVQTQLMSALKYLSLLSDDKKPAGVLPQLVEAYGDDAEFKKILGMVIRGQYSFLNTLDLNTATPTMFAEAFRTTFGGQEATLAKCRIFYLQAAKYVGIELGPRITAGTSGPRASTGTPRKRAAKRQEDAPAINGNGSSKNHLPAQPVGMMEKLMDKFPKFDPKWDVTTQGKWFEAFNKLMSNAEAQKDNGG